MTPDTLSPIGGRASSRTLLRAAVSALLLVFAAFPSAAADSSRKAFDIPAGEARNTLKQFSTQAGGRVLYSGDVVEGVTTNAVKGSYSPREALDRMVNGTRLKVSEDTQNGGLAVVRASDPNAPRAAQTTSSDRPRNQNNGGNESATEETITLSPFQVNASDDTGYRATNTLDGSRLNTALRDTPAAISVFTRDFLDDIGATNIESILRYDLNAEIVDDTSDNRGTGQGEGSGSIENGVTWRTRGLGGSTSTNGFRAAGADTDTYNIERVGSNRGPNAILFGSGAAGGVLNFRTKTANVVRNLHNVEFRVGSYSDLRSSLDVNRALIPKKLAVRVMGLLSHTEDQRPHVYTDKRGVTVAAQYRFSDVTNLNVSFDRQLTSGIGSQAWGPLDQVSRFLDALKSGDVVWSQARERYELRDGNPVGASVGVGNKASRTVIVYGPEGPNAPPVLWEGATSAANRTTLATNATRYAGETFTVADEGIVPYNRVSAQGGATYTTAGTSNFTATFNHRWFEKLYMELAYNRATRRSDAAMNNAAQPLQADLNYRLPDGTLNPYFYGNGYYFIGPEQGFRHQRANDNDTMRAAFSYDVQAGKWWGHHRFAVMGERHENRVMQFRAREQWAGAPYGGLPEANQNHVYRRRYFKIDGPLENYTQGYGHDPYYLRDTYQSTRGVGTLSSTWAPPNAGQVFDDETRTDSGLFVMQNYLFNRRLVTTFGWRDDRVEISSPNAIRDPATQIFRVARPGDLGYELREFSEKGSRRSVGAVFHVTTNFSLTANTSTGVELVNNRTRRVLPDDLPPSPFKTRGEDYGLSFSFLENRISGSVRYFESRSDNEDTNSRVQAVFTLPNEDIMSSFAHYFRQTGVTTFAGSDPIQSLDELTTSLLSGANGYLSDNVSSGYEFELIANPTRNWTIRLGYAHAERKRTNVLTEGEGWWADRVELWKSLDTLYTMRTGLPSLYSQPTVNLTGQTGNLTVAQRIASSEEELAAVRAVEEKGYGNRPDKFNLWTRYAFTEGAMKNLSIGGGMRYQARNIAGYDVPTNRVLYGNDSFLVDLMLQYKAKGIFKLLPEKVGVTYQLNVYNLLDSRDVIISSLRLRPSESTSVSGGATGGLATAGANEPYIRRGWRQTPRTTAFTVRLDF